MNQLVGIVREILTLQISSLLLPLSSELQHGFMGWSLEAGQLKMLQTLLRHFAHPTTISPTVISMVTFMLCKLVAPSQQYKNKEMKQESKRPRLDRNFLLY